MLEETMNLEILHGQFTYCIYKSFSYAVYRFEDEKEGNITVTGNLEGVDLENVFTLYGQYVDHPKYGFQFQVLRFERELPTSFDGIVSYLSSELFRGIGKKKAEKIVSALGENCLSILKEDIDVLDEIGIRARDKEVIQTVLSSNLPFEESFYYLIGLGLSMKDLNKLLAFYKENTRFVLEENPYQPYFDIYGIGFKKCEDLAYKIGFSFEDEKRMVALITYLASELSFRTGNTYFHYEELENYFYRYTKGESLDFDLALNAAINEKKIYVEEDRYYHFQQYLAERDIARFLIQNNEVEEVDETLLMEQLSLLENGLSLRYDDKQKEALLNFYRHKISLIVGGPGTGKTTVVKALVETMKALHPTYCLHVVAPTGRAAKRISELCEVSSSTIHSLLKWDKETNTFSYGPDNPLLVDVLIIDEFSMVDAWLFYKLILALFHIKKICIIGDDNQLPSVGPGNLLKDMIVSERFPLTRLKTIFRQAGQSEIISLSNDILKGEVDFSNYQKDIVFLDEHHFDLKREMVLLMRRFLKEGLSLNDLQVLSPMYKGNLGIDSFNSLLQEIFNPKSADKKEYRTAYRLFREQDKILQLKNQNSDDVYNGDIGRIVSIDSKEGSVEIVGQFDDIFVEYRADDVAKIALAYCVSVHKAQGSEYPVVFFAISNSHRMMLNKNLIYTAVSRASRKLILLGNKDAFLEGIQRKMVERKTSLRVFLDHAEAEDEW